MTVFFQADGNVEIAPPEACKLGNCILCDRVKAILCRSAKTQMICFADEAETTCIVFTNLECHVATCFRTEYRAGNVLMPCDVYHLLPVFDHEYVSAS